MSTAVVSTVSFCARLTLMQSRSSGKRIYKVKGGGGKGKVHCRPHVTYFVKRNHNYWKISISRNIREKYHFQNYHHIVSNYESLESDDYTYPNIPCIP